MKREFGITANIALSLAIFSVVVSGKKEPWKKKNSPKRLNTIVYVALEVIRKISILLNPIIPDTSLKVLKIFNLRQNDLQLNSIRNNESLKVNENIKKISILFKKVEND